ncbi:MAG TPA: enoyl-CoA hydratase [Candidatus Limnocylindria bacterium]|nr:enoyl-CoA hydratase [Candidatus Limnocylindria bacterium]
MERKTILVEQPAEHVARIVLNRPETRNAQDTRLLYELNDALDEAAHDREVRVIIVAANGKDFSSGHDLREREHLENQDQFRPVGTQANYRAPGAEGRMAREEEIYLGFCERWRNIPKPTIAAVQGRCISGGLMLVWPMDLIVAADDAQFSDVVVAMGIIGVEYFAHPWEVGVRKAKEMLFTGRPISAEEARMLGMVNQVVPRAELAARTLDLAKEIATKPTFAVKSVKQAVNAAQDAQGRHVALQTAFAIHHLNHSHAMEVFGLPVDPTGIHGSVRKTYKEGEEPFRRPEPR